MSKHGNKFIRPPITDNPKEQGKQVRQQFGKQLKLDASIYQRAHPDKKLMWISDYGTDVQWWLDHGAEPVPRNSVERKTYAGLNDKQTSEWVSEVGGKDSNGNVYRLYLLMIDPDTYDDFKTGPEAQRQEEIMEAMRLGSNQSDIAKHLPGGGGIETYAPNLPTGDGRGFNEIRPQRTS